MSLKCGYLEIWLKVGYFPHFSLFNSGSRLEGLFIWKGSVGKGRVWSLERAPCLACVLRDLCEDRYILPLCPNVAFPKTILGHHAPILCQWKPRDLCRQTHKQLDIERNTLVEEDISGWRSRGHQGEHRGRRAHHQTPARHPPTERCGVWPGAVGGEPGPLSGPTAGENHLLSGSPIC